MIKPDLNKNPSFTVNYDFNRWSDYIELRCLLSQDGEISAYDIVRLICENDDDDVSLMRGTTEYGENLDNLRSKINIYFQYINSRSRHLRDYYPFFVNGNIVSVKKIDKKMDIYIYLLFSSNLSYFSKHDAHLLTKDFEVLCKHALSLIYPNFQTEIFGTANNPNDVFYGGNVIDKLELLANYLSTELSPKCKNNPRYNHSSGDAGLDLVSFLRLDMDNASTSRIPVCFGQCTCSHSKWREKQSEVFAEKWREKFLTLPAYHELIFVPFSLRSISGKWDDEYDDQIYTIAVDRFRIIHILKQCGGDGALLFSELSTHEDLRNLITQFYE